MAATATPTKPKPVAKPRSATITVTGAALALALKRVSAVASRRSAVQALGGVLMTSQGRTTLNLDATDLTTSVRVPIPSSGSTTFEAIVSVDALDKAVKVLGPGEYTLTTNPADQSLQISAGKGVGIKSTGRKNMTLAQLRRADFPSNLDFTPGSLVMDGPVDAIAAVLAFASTDDTRPILTGISFDLTDKVVVATDSYRLGVFDCSGMGRARKDPIIIRARALRQAIVGKPETVRVTDRGPFAVIEVAGVTYVTRKIEGQYPNYRQLVPDKWEWQVGCKHAALLDAAKFADANLTKNAALRLRVDKNSIRLHGHVPDTGSFDTTVDASVANGTSLAEVEIGVAPDYLVDALNALEAGKGVSLQLISPLRPILVKGANGWVLIMPIRLSV